MSAPFSNATEWDIWENAWCSSCLRDAPYRNGISDVGCPLIVQVMCGDTPAEWIEQDTGRISDRYHCINYRSPGSGNPDPRPKPTPRGQGELFEAEPAARMLVQPTISEMLS